MEYSKNLAKISEARLSMDREILSFWIFVEYEEGGGQGIGGITLDNPKKQRQHQQNPNPRRTRRRIGWRYASARFIGIASIFNDRV